MTSTGQHRIVDNEEQERFEILDGDEIVGFSQYARRPGVLALLHTEIDKDREGQGLGGELISAALNAARDEGLAVLPFCSFVNGYIERHPEYADLVPEQFRANFGL